MQQILYGFEIVVFFGCFAGFLATTDLCDEDSQNHATDVCHLYASLFEETVRTHLFDCFWILRQVLETL